MVLCPARGLEGMRWSAEVQKGLEAGRLLLVSPFGANVRRADSHKAERRNRLVVGLAQRLLVIHAAPGGTTAKLIALAGAKGHKVEWLEATLP